MNADDLFIRNRFIELANQAYQKDVMTHSDFLGLHEQELFQSIRHELPPVCCQLMGGYSLSERKLIVFLPYEEYPLIPPYEILKISPLHTKTFEELSHRDYLGAIMSLGMKREQMGDLVSADGIYYLMALTPMASYIQEQLSMVRHTLVKIETIAKEDFAYEPVREHIAGTVASLRLDSIIATGFNESRSHIIHYIEDGKVSVNGQIITTNAYNLHEQDIIAVRGLGKIQYITSNGQTRKGRLSVMIDRFK